MVLYRGGVTVPSDNRDVRPPAHHRTEEGYSKTFQGLHLCRLEKLGRVVRREGTGEMKNAITELRTRRSK